MKLEDIEKDSSILGIVPGQAVKIVSVDAIGVDARTVVYKEPSGSLAERMLFRSDETKLSIQEAGRAWGLDGNAEDFKLAAEAYRIHLAHLFDPMMAVHTSNVDPLPHQITAVYESMLPRQPLRYLLADDPGAGKTIMAGLLIRELMVRGDLKRCLIVAPGNLVEQWQDELDLKFGLSFEIFSREMVEAFRSGNPFEEKDLLIARIDQLARAEDLQGKLENTDWDLIVVDEAHKMSANYFGNKLNKTKRYLLGETLGSLTRHLLLMTATPHNGKDEDFQAFMALIDSDRFYGKYRQGVHQVDTSDLMRRMVKEELLKFDGTPLFPERRAHTIQYKLSRLEAALYAAVTDYVVNEMNRAQRLDDKRKGTVGFALTILQRRLASSPEAIFQSLKRRLGRLERMLEEVKINRRGMSELGNLRQFSTEDLDEIYEDSPDNEIEELEEEIADQATAAQTIQELETEIFSLKNLVAMAKMVREAGDDTKWSELSRLLQDTEEMFDEARSRRKLIIFTEHRDTLNYLHDRISVLLGKPDAIVQIHGGVKREERRKAQELFTQDKDTVVLLATDAAGEGVNLQRANLMINYDLPWNPNRLEQRFGRIHRIGQREVCHMWNLVANETREGDVFGRLFDKLEVERNRLGGKVFDILGQAFEGKSLKDLLIEAIQYGNRPEVKERLFKVVDDSLDTDHLKNILERSALAAEHMSPDRIFRIKEKMEKAEALRLQPHYIRAYFDEAFTRLGGDLKKREKGRFEITHVPASIRQRDRVIGLGMPVLRKYQRVCFEKSSIHLDQKPIAALVAPGHPLMDAVIDLTLETHRSLLKQGTIFVAPKDHGTKPRMLYMLDHSIRDGGLDKNGGQRTISRRMQMILMDSDGNAIQAGPAPHLDYRMPDEQERRVIESLLNESWIMTNQEPIALSYAAKEMVPGHLEEVKLRRERIVSATLEAVHERLTKEINYWTHRYQKLQIEVEAGKQPNMQPENARRRAEELTVRLEQRTAELEAQRNIISSTPSLCGCALVVPAGWLDQKLGRVAEEPDMVSRKRAEEIAMMVVMENERQLGFHPVDVANQNLGWDITSTDSRGSVRFLEVKGRAHGADSVHVTRNEMLVGFNKQDNGWFLVIVQIHPDEKPETPVYLNAPFDREPGWAEIGVDLSIPKLLKGQK